MGTQRKIKKMWQGKQTSDGAGVRLTRVFGYYEVQDMDPFLLLDAFGSDNPDDYIAGFPWHPHRGIETITYMLNGKVKHGDSLGNSGVIRGGDVQWMTAGSGIVHEEMPERSEGKMAGFQLWANLPSHHKMMHPRYQDIKSEEIPEIKSKSGAKVRVICGEFEDTKGPVQDIVTDPEYFDVTLADNENFSHQVKQGYTAFAYVFEGAGSFGPDKEEVSKGTLALFDDGTEIVVRAGNDGIRFLMISGKPLNEPIAWRGPIVMNTDEELRVAFDEYRRGTFLKDNQE
ncbi:MAG: pirin family protein [Candidatus Thorarchaeota archaeon]|jgi:redox-sensitive bicupin YhaK (pirin superfamily)